jgi:peroxiredoxin
MRTRDIQDLPTLIHAERLASLREQHTSLLSPEISQRLKAQVEHLRSDDRHRRLLRAGERAPAFSLSDQYGATVHSAELLEKGPLIVWFIRESSCAYCSDDIAALLEAYPEVLKGGAELVVVTPRLAGTRRVDRVEHPRPFPILVDADFSVQLAFGVTYCLPEHIKTLYRSMFSNDVTLTDDRKVWPLPIRARFVISSEGTIIDVQRDGDCAPPEESIFPALDEVENERPARLGDFLRQVRTGIPAGTKSLGTFIRRPNRVAKGVCQEELAEAIGVSRDWYGMIERGRPVRPSRCSIE